MKKKPLTYKNGEARELTYENFFKTARPGRELFTPEQAAIVQAIKRKHGQRGPGKKQPKEHITLRLDPDVVAHYRDLGPGWQKRINEDLRRNAKL